MLIRDNIPSLISGVSQQPPVLRLPSQLEEQINGHSSEVDGLRKRPPLEFTGRIADQYTETPFIHTFTDSRGAAYLAVFDSTSVRVYDLDGVEQTVNVVDAGYLSAEDTPMEPRDKFRAITLADTTFLLNKGVVSNLAANLTPVRDPEAIVVFQQGAYGKRYTIEVQRNGATTVHTGTYLVPNGDTPSHAQMVGTEYIAEQVFNDFDLNDLAADGFDIVLEGSVIYFKNVTDDFAIRVFDDFNNNGAVAFKGRIQRFSALPAVAPEGFQLEVIGDSATGVDNYYVRFEKIQEDDLIGIWRETAGPGVKDTIDASTMPFSLEALDDGTFEFGPVEWTTRKAGTEVTLPPPSFLGRKLNDVFVFRNRLGFVARDSIVLSSSNDLFNFFGLTVTGVLDTAPIDVSAADSASDIHAATPFQDSLILWGTRKQIALLSDAVLTPRSVSLRPLTQYACSPLVRPVVLGQEVFFPKTVGEFSRLQAYTVRPDGLNYEADDATVQAPKYFPGDIRVLAASPLVNTTVAIAPSAPNTLWVYKSYWEAGQKIQSAIYRWTFPATMRMLHAAFEGERFIIVWDEADGAYMGQLELAEGYSDPGTSYLTHLDRRVSSDDLAAPSYSPDVTRILLPYLPTEKTRVVSRAPDAEPSEVAVVDSFGDDPTDGFYIDVVGDWSARDFWVGDLFPMEFTLSPIYFRRALGGGGTAPVVTGRLQLRYITLNYSSTGSFTVDVTNRARTTASLTYSAVSTGRSLGEAVSDEVPVSVSGSFRFPVLGRNTETLITIRDETHLPATFPSYEFEAFYHQRASG